MEGNTNDAIPVTDSITDVSHMHTDSIQTVYQNDTYVDGFEEPLSSLHNNEQRSNDNFTTPSMGFTTRGIRDDDSIHLLRTVLPRDVETFSVQTSQREVQRTVIDQYYVDNTAVNRSVCGAALRSRRHHRNSRDAINARRRRRDRKRRQNESEHERSIRLANRRIERANRAARQRLMANAFISTSDETGSFRQTTAGSSQSDCEGLFNNWTETEVLEIRKHYQSWS